MGSSRHQAVSDDQNLNKCDEFWRKAKSLPIVIETIPALQISPVGVVRIKIRVPIHGFNVSGIALCWHPSRLVETIPEVLRLGLFKSITATDRTDLQVERGKFGVPTVIQNRVRRLSAGSDLRQIKVGIADVVLSEVEAESALSIMKLSHAESRARLGPHFDRPRMGIRSPPWKRSYHGTNLRQA